MKNQPAVLRAVYIVLVPVVALIILLNSGWLQRFLPAASIHGESLSVVRYNFYYFDYYNSFLEENETRLNELGYDPQLKDGEQRRADGQTWKEFFMGEAEAVMAETAYYCDLAVAAGYQFSEAELAPVQERLDADAALRALYGISDPNFYVAYYGPGMDGERYLQELTRKVQAQAYKAHLAAQLQPDREAVARWLAEHPSEEYRAADLRVITLEALPDRATGEIGQEQLAALRAKLDKLIARYNSGVDFNTLQAAFSTCAIGGADGVFTDAVREDLPPSLAGMCFEDQDDLLPGSAFSGIDDESGTAYFVLLDGFGGSGPETAAAAAVSAQAVQAQEDEMLGAYQVERSPIGILLATA